MQKRNPMFNKADTKITFDEDTMKIVSFFFVKIHLYNCPKSCNFNQFFEAN